MEGYNLESSCLSTERGSSNHAAMSFSVFYTPHLFLLTTIAQALWSVHPAEPQAVLGLLSLKFNSARRNLQLNILDLPCQA